MSTLWKQVEQTVLSKKTMFKARVLRIVEAKDIRAGLDVKFIILFIYSLEGVGVPKGFQKSVLKLVCMWYVRNDF